jgi:cysteine desulfurase
MASVGVYLDAATSAPLHPVARQALLAALDDGWADPGRLYAPARRARQLLDAARSAVAEVVGVRDDEVSFQPSGSAALRSAIAGVLAGRARVGAGFVYSAVEHSAVIKAAGDGGTPVPVDRLGRVDLEAFAASVRRPEVALAALQSANHEVGTVQPVAATASLCAEAGVPLLVDAAQTVGRMAVPDGWALLTASARKWGGPPGVGILAVRKGTRYEPVTRIRETVAATVPDVEVVGDPDDRLPHVVTFSCLYVDGEALLHALDRRGFAVSSGSACTADTLRPSHVLEAMGVLTHGNVRVSLHPGVSPADVDAFLAALPEVVSSLRAELGAQNL